MGAFVVDACIDCGGIFIDNAATQELVRAFDRELVTLATTLGIGKGETIGSNVLQHDIACPHCTSRLEPVNLPSASLEIDICAEHGTWFDANELPKVARAYRRHREGVVTDMAEDELTKILSGSFRA